MEALVSVDPTVRIARLLLTAVAAALGVATMVVLPRSDVVFVSQAAASPSAEVADLAAGLGLLGVGLLVWLDRPGSSQGLVAALAGVAWFAPDWVGWEGGPPIARSVAMLVEPFFLPLMMHLVLAGTGGRLAPGRARTAVRAVYAVAAIVSVGRALFRDPFLDPYCWNNCTENVFLLAAAPNVARSLDVAWVLFSVVVGLALTGIAGRSLLIATAPARRAWWPILVPGAVLASATAGHAILLILQPLERVGGPVFSAVFQTRAWSTAALAVGVGWVVVRARRAREAVSRLASDLGEAPPPGSLGPALARATGDPSLDVVYPLPEDGRYVDPSGWEVDPPSAVAGRAVTLIVRDGREVAAVLHDAGAVDAEQLRLEIGAAARLAVENERLQAEVRAHLQDLRASRSRVVEAGDAERRQLERNLHDGAQQRVLALSYDLRRAHAAAGGRHDEQLEAVLRAAAEEANEVLAELRELAHGIYPAILTEAGIGPALWTLADSAPLPIEVSEAPTERLPEATERTAFVVVSEAVAAADRMGSTHVVVRAFAREDRLFVEVEGAGPGPFEHLVDRVGALGGAVTIEAALLRAEIPCG